MSVRTLIAGVGYSDLSDFSVGPVLASRLAGETWPPGIVVENLSYGPVAVVHRLDEERPPFDRLVVFGAVQRGHPPGALTVYRWDARLPDDGEIQERVAEAVTGVVGLDNLLIVTRALGAARPEVVVVEIEPLVEELGDGFSPEVASAVEEARFVVRELAMAPVGAEVGPEAPLGGPRPAFPGNGEPAATPAEPPNAEPPNAGRPAP